MSEPTFEQITMAAIAFVGNDMWDSLDRFGKAKARTRARQALIVAAPSPSPAPGVVEALELARDRLRFCFASDRKINAEAIAKIEAALASLSQSVEKEERPVSYHDWLLSTSPSQPAKGEREGGASIVDENGNTGWVIP